MGRWLPASWAVLLMAVWVPPLVLPALPFHKALAIASHVSQRLQSAELILPVSPLRLSCMPCHLEIDRNRRGALRSRRTRALTRAAEAVQPRQHATIEATFLPKEASVFVAQCVCTVPGDKSHIIKIGGIGKYPFLTCSSERVDCGSVLKEVNEVVN